MTEGHCPNPPSFSEQPPRPESASEHGYGYDRAHRTPTRESRGSVRLPDLFHNLLHAQPRRNNFLAQRSLQSRCTVPHLVREKLTGASLDPLHRELELRQPGGDVLVYLLQQLAHHLPQSQLVQRHQRERRIALP